MAGRDRRHQGGEARALQWPPAEADVALLAGLPRGGGRVRIEAGPELTEVVLDQPEVFNALSPGMMAELLDLARTLEAAPPRALLLRGEGLGAFCAGGDLRAVRTHLLDQRAGAAMSRVMGAALDRISSLSTLVVGAVEGVALGGGAELLTCCDRIFCSEQARVGFVHAALGVGPGWGGGRRLRARVGPAACLDLLARARRVKAAEALAMGLVDEVCPPGGAAAAARSWLEQALQLPEEAVRASKRIAHGVSASHEAALFAELWGGPAHRRALGLEPTS